MKLSISNIAWGSEDDEKIYGKLNSYGFSAIEIAPTRVFPDAPYDNLPAAASWSKRLSRDYGLTVSSMQSIWFGKTESIFGTGAERRLLTDYTFKAIDFAQAVNCKNLVFGCPKNRNKPEDKPEEIAFELFREIGEYAFSKGVSINVEANPPIYNTNYINTTKQSFELVKKVDSKGFNINLDLGTVIENSEDICEIEKYSDFIKHIHISEPFLKVIKERSLHRELAAVLKAACYPEFVSIEMGRQDDISVVEKVLKYVGDIFL